MKKIRTSVLEIAYEERGSKSGQPLLMLHGYPDDPRTFDVIAKALEAKGFWIIVPYQRGYGDTKFLNVSEPRTGQQAALAQDVIDLADALEIEKFVLAGHDWGAYSAYLAANLYPERVQAIVAMSVGYTGGQEPTLSFEQLHAYWYQWMFNLKKGEEKLTEDRVNLGRFLWHIASPSWKFDEETLAKTALSWSNPDFVAITLSSYRTRWKYAPGVEKYDALMERVKANPQIAVPTIVLHGQQDGTALVDASANQEHLFTGFYERRVIADAGHFITRERPDDVVQAVLDVTAVLK